MKKIIAYLIALTLLVTSIIPINYVSASDVPYMTLEFKPSMNSIKLKWEKIKGATNFKIYKVECTKKVETNAKAYKMKKYKLLANVFKKRTYTDKKVKINHAYAYYIKAYKKKKLIASSFSKGYMNYEYAGLAMPLAENRDNGEDGANTPNRLNVVVFRDTGVLPDKYIYYRKGPGEKKFKKLGTLKGKKKKYYYTYSDKTVTPLKEYTYKVRAVKKYKKKNIYSTYSQKVKIKAVNSDPILKVETLTRAGNLDQFVIKVTSADKYNGDLIIDKDAAYGNIDYICNVDGDDIEFSGKIIAYSEDNVDWAKFSDSKYILTPEKSIYLKIGIKKSQYDPPELVPVFGGDTASLSILNVSSNTMDYKGSCLKKFRITLDLVKKEGHFFYES